MDGGDLVLLTLLDLSASFDMVDHVKLLRRLEVKRLMDSVAQYTTGVHHT